MDFIADLHTHTLVSNHAYNTVTEMVTQAKKLGLYAMAVTDHGVAMPDAPHLWYFYNIHSLPDIVDGVWLLKGTEANVMDVDGTLDFSDDLLKRFDLDWIIVSIHSDTLAPKLDFDSATKLWFNVAENPYVDMIGHSESRFHEYDYDAVTKVFAKNNKVVEMNGNSANCRPGNEENMRRLALACKKNGTKIAVNSDAHSIYSLADVDTVTPMLKEIKFPRELIVNATKENLIAELKLHGKKIAAKMEEQL